MHVGHLVVLKVFHLKHARLPFFVKLPRRARGRGRSGQGTKLAAQSPGLCGRRLHEPAKPCCQKCKVLQISCSGKGDQETSFANDVCFSAIGTSSSCDGMPLDGSSIAAETTMTWTLHIFVIGKSLRILAIPLHALGSMCGVRTAASRGRGGSQGHPWQKSQNRTSTTRPTVLI